MYEKKGKIIRSIEFIILILMLCVLKENKLYAAAISVGYESYTMEYGQTKEFFVRNATKAGYWSYYTDRNNGVISAYKRTDRGYTRIECKGLKEGTARLWVKDGVTGVAMPCYITITKPPTDLKINGLSYTNEIPLFEGLEKTMRISTKYGWTVYSPNVNIIKVTDINHNNNTVTYKALNDGYFKSFDNHPRGKTFIRITENVTGHYIDQWVHVKAYVQNLTLSSNKSTENVRAGQTCRLTLRTYPINYIDENNNILPLHGTITWKIIENSRYSKINE